MKLILQYTIEQPKLFSDVPIGCTFVCASHDDEIYPPLHVKITDTEAVEATSVGLTWTVSHNPECYVAECSSIELVVDESLRF